VAKPDGVHRVGARGRNGAEVEKPRPAQRELRTRRGDPEQRRRQENSGDRERERGQGKGRGPHEARLGRQHVERVGEPGDQREQCAADEARRESGARGRDQERGAEYPEAERHVHRSRLALTQEPRGERGDDEGRRADRDERHDHDAAEGHGREVGGLIAGHARAHREAAPAITGGDGQRCARDQGRPQQEEGGDPEPRETDQERAGRRAIGEHHHHRAARAPQHRRKPDEDETAGGPGRLTGLRHTVIIARG
jgi:hypothetical protein